MLPSASFDSAAFLLALFAVAFLYASIGHGGASGYLAVMALFGIAPQHMKSAVLLLNLLVSLMSFLQYWHKGHFKARLFWPFAMASIPAAFVGALLPIWNNLYKQLLGACLLLSVFRLVMHPSQEDSEVHPPRWSIALLTGALIGLLSGILGIGGGILLSPLLLLFHWANMKQTAAVSALFIFVNSLAGIIGMTIQGTQINPQVIYWLIIAFAGGLSGAYLGSKKFNFTVLKYILAIVLLLASVKLLFVA